MDRFQALVRDFHQNVTKQPTSPAMPALRNVELRAIICVEEAIELAFALVGQRAQTIIQEQLIRAMSKLARRKWDGQPNVLDVIGEVCDVLVVSYGTAEDIGVDIEPFFVEIMKSNLAKKGGVIDDTGKLLKPPGWEPANLVPILERAIAAAQHMCEHCGGSNVRADGVLLKVCDECHYGTKEVK